jgi:TnpA family transposase
MPVDFLTSEQKAQYGQFFGEPNDTQLARYFHLDKTDLSLIAGRRGDQNRFGFALQLTSARFLGTFLLDINLVPVNAQVFVARQLCIPDMAVLGDYAKREATKHEHTPLICQHYGYRDFGELPWAFRLIRLLYIRAWVSNERPSLMFDFATNWLMQHKILLPGITTLSRLITEIRERADDRLWERLSAIPTNEQREKLESILKIQEGMCISRFDYFRKGPFTISAPAFNAALDRYLELQKFGLDDLNFAHIPPVRLKILASMQA